MYRLKVQTSHNSSFFVSDKIKYILYYYMNETVSFNLITLKHIFVLNPFCKTLNKGTSCETYLLYSNK